MQEIQKRQVTCFLIASAGLPVDDMINLFRRSKIRVTSLTESQSLGRTISEALKSTMLKADFVLAIIGNKTYGGTTENIYFEIGYATALGKKIIVVLPESESIPAILEGTLTIRANLGNFEALQFAIDQVLNRLLFEETHKEPNAKLNSINYNADREVARNERLVIPKIYPQEKRLSKSKGIGAKSNTFIEMINNQGNQISEMEIQNIIIEALQEGGISTVRRSSETMSVPDIAVWVDERGFSSGPTLIEVKKYIDDEQQANEIKEQMTKYLSQIGGRFALVLYTNGIHSNTYINPIFESFIHFMPVNEFLKKLSNHSFSTLIRNIVKSRYKEDNR